MQMSALTIRLPDDKHDWLKALAESRQISVNKLVDELATVDLANFDARSRYEVRARKGYTKKAIRILDRLGYEGDE
jgi:predicted DNA-binding ribbon-helix-helix protein